MEHMKKLWIILKNPIFLNLVKDNNDENLTLIQIGFRVIASLIMGLWIGFLPIYLFIIYMLYNNFFSYDFFVEGIFGLKIFIISSAIILCAFSLYHYGFLLTAKLGLQEQKRQGKNTYRLVTWILIVVSAITHLFIIQVFFAKNKPELILWIMSLSIIFTLFFLMQVGNSIKSNLKNWKPSIIFVAFTIIFPIFTPQATSTFIGLGLAIFKVGGGKNITIKKMDESIDASFNGKLILLTPKNAYVHDKRKNLYVIPVSENTALKIW